MFSIAYFLRMVDTQMSLVKRFKYLKFPPFKVGVEGTGFEPTIDALFGERGFFPEPISKVMYWAGDKAQMLKDVLERITPSSNRMKRQRQVT